MKLRADAVVFRLQPEGWGERKFFKQRAVVLLVAFERRGEHALDRHQRAERGLAEFSMAGEQGRFPDVAGEHVRVPDVRGIRLESGGDGILDEAFLQADAEVAGEQLDDGFAFDRMQGGEAVGEPLDAVERAGCVSQSWKNAASPGRSSGSGLRWIS